MSKVNYFLVLVAVAIIAVGQIIFKYSAQHLRIEAGRSWVDLFLANRFPAGLLLLAVFLYFMATIAWVQALRTVALSVAYMFNSLAFVIVPLVAFLLFGEHIPRFFLPGTIMIIGGILLVSWGG